MQKPVVVVGAGLAGLVCARRLQQAGLDVVIIDGADAPGGRVRTDRVDGFLLDRGFQVYFEAYPNARLELDLGRLRLKDFEPGCLVFDGRKMREVHREHILQSAFGGWISVNDLLRLYQLGSDLDKMSESDIWSMEDVPLGQFLAARKVSASAIDRFIRPFFGGVFLDRSLDVSCRPFAFYWQMLDRSPATIPALGMQAIPDQIMEGVDPGSLRMGTRAVSLHRESGRVAGVILESGETVAAETVVLAVDQPESCRLSGIGTPWTFKSCATVHFAVAERPWHESILILNGTDTGLVNHVACLTNASRELAPAGQHLVAATVLGNPRGTDLNLAKSVQYELSGWFKDQKLDSWRPLRVDRIPRAQMPQPVGFDRFLTPQTPEPGLVVAGEHTTYAGIDGAILSGQQAAAHVLSPERELVGA